MKETVFKWNELPVGRCLFIVATLIACVSPSFSQDYELVFSDEFSYSGLPDEQKWGYDVGGHGWGNDELQYYTGNRIENARVENGNLVIEARKETYVTRSYTSARLVTRNRGDWTYGRMEVRARLPSGRGTWPAIWMLPTDRIYGDWPSSGEIDIMEHVGYDPLKVHATVHTHDYNHILGTQKGSSLTVPDCESAFHVYAIEWNSQKIDFFVDEVKYFTFNNEGTWQKWPFDKRFHMILNIAVGGTWGGAQGIDDSIFPTTMLVDYVRVYQPVNKVSISGQAFIKPFTQNLTFTAPQILNASYHWTLPGDAVIVAGANTNRISVNWGGTEGKVILEVGGNNIYRDTLNVLFIETPTQAVYTIDDFNDGDHSGWKDPDTDENLFSFSESGGELKIHFDVPSPLVSPRIEYSLPRPVDLSGHTTMVAKVKSGSQVNIRFDLGDVFGVQTNSPPAFSLLPLPADNTYHIYHYNFSGDWGSDFPLFGDLVDSTRISKLIVYINYGVFGVAGKKGDVWFDNIEMTSEPLRVHTTRIPDIRIYPNPVKDLLHIQPVVPIGRQGKIMIFNAAGICCHTGRLDPGTQVISVKQLPPGMYFLNISGDEYGTAVKKFIRTEK